MNRLITPLCFIVVACSLGCDCVVLNGRIGDPLSQAETSFFTGRWTNEESEVVDVRLLADNKLIVGSLVWDGKKKEFVVQNHKVTARRVDGVTYLLLGADDDDAYGFVRIGRIGDNELKMFLPDPGAFRTAVQNGEVDGKVNPRKNDHFTVVLESQSHLTQRVLSRKELRGLYKADDSQTMRRIKRWEDKE